MSNLETVMGAINNLKAVWELDSQMAKDLRKSSRLAEKTLDGLLRDKLVLRGETASHKTYHLGLGGKVSIVESKGLLGEEALGFKHEIAVLIDGKWEVLERFDRSQAVPVKMALWWLCEPDRAVELNIKTFQKWEDLVWNS